MACRSGHKRFWNQTRFYFFVFLYVCRYFMTEPETVLIITDFFICWILLFQISSSINIFHLKWILCWKLVTLLWPKLQMSNMSGLDVRGFGIGLFKCPYNLLPWEWIDLKLDTLHTILSHFCPIIILLWMHPNDISMERGKSKP